MLIQSLIVGLVVLACVAYSIWTLMPAAWRRALASRLLQRRALAGQDWLQRAARGGAGCASGCDGCGEASKPAQAPGAPQVIKIHRRRT
jgi:hypothetical protein